MKKNYFTVLAVVLIFAVIGCKKETNTVQPEPTKTIYTLELQEGLNSYSGTTDTQVAENTPNLISGDSNTMQTGVVGVNGLKRSFIRFDLSSVPAGSTIVSADLILQFNNVNGANFNLKLQPMDRAWVESECNWTNAASGLAWTLAGGDFANSNIAMPLYIDTASAVNTYTFNISAYMMQYYIDGTWQNYGFILRSDSETSSSNFAAIYTSEATTQADRPMLRIKYY